MPMIEPRTEHINERRLITYLWDENHEALYAYANMIGETPKYVLNGLVEVMAKDKDFKKWMDGQTGKTFAPKQTVRGEKTAKKRTASPLRTAV